MKVTQALTQVQSTLVEKQSKAEWENIALKVKWDEEKAQFLVEQLEVHKKVQKELHSVMVIEIKI